MKKIQSRYLLWTLVATFSLNVAAPIFAEEPKQEKLSFAQRIKLLRRAKEWMKETRELGKKVKAGTATEKEKKRWDRRVGGSIIISMLLMSVPFWVWAWRLKKEGDYYEKEAKRREITSRGLKRELKQFNWRRALQEERLLALQEGRMQDKRLATELIDLLRAARVIEGMDSRDNVITEIKTQIETEIQEELREEGVRELMGTPRDQAKAILDRAVERVKKLNFDLLEERGEIEEIMAKVRRAEGAGVRAEGLRGALLKQ